eukprot:TRINITY_DN688_c0_g1_i1.p1 TRINITY_DN688_c0_g1~~TRINITY_DN688_c0_g1_i1.p1  ORF type:complete len:300 (-),score=84.84 TRINITY_DN688_c0_g1_i1:37-936(-)
MRSVLRKENMNSVALNDGTSIPCIGIGSGTAWFKTDVSTHSIINRELVDSVKSALSLGFYHIDTAEGYGTEGEIGAAIKESGLPREKIFVTTKVFKNIKDPKQALENSLAKMGLDYVDLYLIHAPFFSVEKSGISPSDAWKALEELKKEGKTKSIGVSNYRVSDLKSLLTYAKIKPSVNQIELNPYLPQQEIVDFCKENDIKVECYTPLAPIVHVPDGPLSPVLSEMSSRLGKTPAQILFAWSLQQGRIIVTTSSKEERLKEYLEAASIKLSEEDIQKISTVGKPVQFRKFWTKEDWSQ